MQDGNKVGVTAIISRSANELKINVGEMETEIERIIDRKRELSRPETGCSDPLVGRSCRKVEH